jgi:hypothetical protein
MNVISGRAVPKPLRLTRSTWSHSVVVAFCACFAGTLAVGLLQGARVFYADSFGYWRVSALFVRNGHFSILNYSDRAGYVFPLILHLLRAFTERIGMSQSSIQFSVNTVLNAVLFALIGAVLAPRLAEVTWPDQRWGLLRRAGLTALLLIFWSGDLNYPMTDFPGLTFACLALVAIAQPNSPSWMLLAGAASAVAINMRPAYLPLLPILAVIVGLAWVKRGGNHPAPLARRWLCVGLFAVGFVTLSLPQSLTSHRYHNTWTFISETTAPPGPPFLLTFGMAYQRVDAYIGPEGPSALIYGDRTGRALLEREPKKEITGPGEYVGVVLAHPFVMIPVFARHLIDGLDARYSTIYVQHRDSDGHLWLRLGGFLIVFLALLRLLWPAARRSLGRSRWRYLIALSFCCLTILATAVETRYLLPIYLLCYILVMAPGWPNPLGRPELGLQRWRTPAILAAAYLVFMAIIWHVVGGLHGEVAFSLPVLGHSVV